MLSDSVLHLYEQFKVEESRFALIKYDVFDIKDDSFEKDYGSFMKWPNPNPNPNPNPLRRIMDPL